MRSPILTVHSAAVAPFIKQIRKKVNVKMSWKKNLKCPNWSVHPILLLLFLCSVFIVTKLWLLVSFDQMSFKDTSLFTSNIVFLETYPSGSQPSWGHRESTRIQLKKQMVWDVYECLYMLNRYLDDIWPNLDNK